MRDTEAAKRLGEALAEKRIRETSQYVIMQFVEAITRDLDGAAELILRCHNGHVDAELRLAPPGSPPGQVHAT